ncbi:C40 family peptidase [Prauserella sp. ASG 168]|uniref:C40 family peptidase n=1 Tax=Prauserella cavernicola TaxID=2800127 RepID=A0A934QVJ7_9PSEU|nr:C40 family peptidase [Prauserella cavernicola]
MTVRWRIDDTGTAANISPVLRIQARDADGSAAPFVFPGDNAYFILRGGNGHHEVGLRSDWNPSNLADINRLRVRVQNGTTAQGTHCYQERDIFNWTRIGYRKAVDQQGKSYVLGGTGPNSFDCSGLALTSYEAIPHFPDFPSGVRTAEQIYFWMRDNTSPSKRYAKPVATSDLKIGDLLFFERTANNGRVATHVAFWAGDNKLFHALSPQFGIDFGSYSSYFSSRFIGAYRVLGVATVANG